MAWLRQDGRLCWEEALALGSPQRLSPSHCLIGQRQLDGRQTLFRSLIWQRGPFPCYCTIAMRGVLPLRGPCWRDQVRAVQGPGAKTGNVEQGRGAKTGNVEPSVILVPPEASIQRERHSHRASVMELQYMYRLNGTRKSAAGPWPWLRQV